MAALGYNRAMRNTGWYIPYWRKIKKKGKQDKPNAEAIARSDEQLESVRRRWIERYRRTLRSLRIMDLSVGSNRADVQEHYNHLRGAGMVRPHDLEEAYRYLMRVLPPPERRKRRPSPSGSAASGIGEGAGAAQTEAALSVDSYTETLDIDAATVEVYTEARAVVITVDADEDDENNVYIGDDEDNVYTTDDEETDEAMDAESAVAEREASLPREESGPAGAAAPEY